MNEQILLDYNSAITLLKATFGSDSEYYICLQFESNNLTRSNILIWKCYVAHTDVTLKLGWSAEYLSPRLAAREMVSKKKN